MNKIILTVLLLLISNICYAKPNYTYTTNTDGVSVLEQENAEKPNRTKVNYSLHSNRAYITIKSNNKRSINISTPKLSNNKYLQLVNIVF